MTAYSIALFVHIVGALGFFVALGVEWLSVRRIRLASTGEQVGEWIGIVGGVGRVGMASMVALLLSGFAMMATSWGGAAWILVSLGTIVLMAVVAAALSGRHMGAIRRAVGAEMGPLSPALRGRLQHPLLWLALQMRVALALGIVFLMSVKPELPGALLSVGVAAALGLFTALPFPGRAHTGGAAGVKSDWGL